MLWGWPACPRDESLQVGWDGGPPILHRGFGTQHKTLVGAQAMEILAMNGISCYPPPKLLLKPTRRAVSWAGSIITYTLSKRNLGDPSVPSRTVDQGTGALSSAVMGRGQQHGQGGDRELGAAASCCSEMPQCAHSHHPRLHLHLLSVLTKHLAPSCRSTGTRENKDTSTLLTFPRHRTEIGREKRGPAADLGRICPPSPSASRAERTGPCVVPAHQLLPCPAVPAPHSHSSPSLTTLCSAPAPSPRSRNTQGPARQSPRPPQPGGRARTPPEPALRTAGGRACMRLQPGLCWLISVLVNQRAGNRTECAGAVRPGKALGRHRSIWAAPEAVGKAQGVCRVPGREQGGEGAWRSPYSAGGKEMGTTLPAPLKPEHGGRENQGEK